MKTKNTLRALVVAAIVFALYNMLVFMIPFERETGFWLSYGFTLAAFLIGGIAVYLGVLKSNTTKGNFYSFPIARIGLNYLILQILAGFVVMLLGQWLAWWIITLLFAAGMAVAVILLISAEATVDQIQTMDGQLKARVSHMRSIQSKVCQLEGKCADADAAAAVKALSEELRYSDPVSSVAVAETENELSALVDALTDAVADGEAAVIIQLSKRASVVLSERNRICKLNK